MRFGKFVGVALLLLSCGVSFIASASVQTIVGDTVALTAGKPYTYTGNKFGDAWRVRVSGLGERVDGLTLSDVADDTSGGGESFGIPTELEVTENVTAGGDLSSAGAGKLKNLISGELRAAIALRSGTSALPVRVLLLQAPDMVKQSALFSDSVVGATANPTRIQNTTFALIPEMTRSGVTHGKKILVIASLSAEVRDGDSCEVVLYADNGTTKTEIPESRKPFSFNSASGLVVTAGSLPHVAISTHGVITPTTGNNTFTAEWRTLSTASGNTCRGIGTRRRLDVVEIASH